MATGDVHVELDFDASDLIRGLERAERRLKAMGSKDDYPRPQTTLDDLLSDDGVSSQLDGEAEGP